MCKKPLRLIFALLPVLQRTKVVKRTADFQKIFV